MERKAEWDSYETFKAIADRAREAQRNQEGLPDRVVEELVALERKRLKEALKAGVIG